MELICDEIFHIPQGIKYCNYEFSNYNPKLTTPPGLYISSLLLSFATNSCSILTLRALNFLYALATLYSCYRIHSIIHSPHPQSFLSSFNIIFFPVSFFYHFLYYTDSGSTFWVVLALQFALQKSYFKSSISCVISILFRQTNIIWTAFIFGISFLDIVKSQNKNPTLSEIYTAIYRNFKLFIKLIPFLIPFLGFLGFIIYNNGIVLGDKTNHKASLHLVQVFYFAAFTLFFTFPLINHLNLLKKFILISRNNYILLSGIIISMILIIQKFTIEHPFLLSDNRHFSFYIWRWIFRSFAINRFLLIPGYLISIYAIILNLNSSMGCIRTCGYIICVILALVPSPLLEFRYFIIPFTIYRLYLKPNHNQILLEFAFYSLINAIAFGLFLYKPFEWTHEPGKIQRFMW